MPGITCDAFIRDLYLPDNTEGRDIMRMLQLAWHRKLLLRVGFNPLTHKMDTIVANGFELKWNRIGGILNGGYPDDSYFSRLRMDLKDVGII
jgi:deltex-like protein